MRAEEGKQEVYVERRWAQRPSNVGVGGDKHGEFHIVQSKHTAAAGGAAD